MSMSLAELDAQDVMLLPERATLHHGGLTITVITSDELSSRILNVGAFNFDAPTPAQLIINSCN